MNLVGRLKELIISGGENVYPAEVERVVRSVEGVVDACAFGVPHARFGEAVAVAVIVEPGAVVTAEAVLDASAAGLAKFKRPVAVVFVDEFPRTATGKVRRTAVRDLATAG